MKVFIALCWIGAVTCFSNVRDCGRNETDTLQAYIQCILELRKGTKVMKVTPSQLVNDKEERKIFPPVQHSSQPKDEVRPKEERKRLAILVPFRNCFEELLQFIPHMHKFLNQQKLRFDIFIIQQSDDNRFNRASLINVGYLYVQKDYDYLAIHDIHILPLNNRLHYGYPDQGPLYIATNYLGKSSYEEFIEGILLISKEDYKQLNGMSNNNWGWGIKDDELFLRLRYAGLVMHRLQTINMGFNDTFKHLHAAERRARDERWCNISQPTDYPKQRDLVSGLNSVEYNLISVHKVNVDNMPATLLDVQLLCNRTVTPWCRCGTPMTPKPPLQVLLELCFELSCLI